MWRWLRDQYWILAAGGAILSGLTLPGILLAFNIGVGESLRLISRVEFWLFIAFVATGAFLLGLWLFYDLVRRWEWLNSRPPLLAGAMLGVVLAFMNLPGYLAYELLKGDFRIHRLIALFLVAGSTSGAWIAWQAYRTKKPEVPFWPQYSIRSLLLLIIAWGALLALFAPKRA